MIVYSVATILAVILGYIAQWKRADNKTLPAMSSRYRKSMPQSLWGKSDIFWLAASFLPLFLVSGLRWNVGRDFGWVYVSGFYSIAQGRTTRWEPGFVLLNKAVQLFSLDPMWIMLLTSFLFLFFTYRAIADTAVNRGLSILFAVLTGFYFHSFNGIRQWLTLSMFLYAIKYIREKRFWRYLIIILLASTIHSSALIYIPVYFLCQLRIPPKRAVFALVISILCLPVVRSFFTIIVAGTKYSFYLASKYNRFDFSVTDFIVGLSLLLLGYFYYPRDELDENYSIFMNLQLIAFIVSLYSSVIILAFRIVPCFTATQLFLIPLILAREKDVKTRRLLTTFIVICFIAVCAYTFGVLGWSNIFPYQSVFSRV